MAELTNPEITGFFDYEPYGEYDFINRKHPEANGPAPTLHYIINDVDKYKAHVDDSSSRVQLVIREEAVALIEDNFYWFLCTVPDGAIQRIAENNYYYAAACIDSSKVDWCDRCTTKRMHRYIRAIHVPDSVANKLSYVYPTGFKYNKSSKSINKE